MQMETMLALNTRHYWSKCGKVVEEGDQQNQQHQQHQQNRNHVEVLNVAERTEKQIEIKIAHH